jgi:hypothetical protein
LVDQEAADKSDLDNGVHIVRYDVDIDSKPKSNKSKWPDFGGDNPIVRITKNCYFKRNFTASN